MGPFLVGALKHSRGDYSAACIFLAFMIAFGAGVAYVMLPIVSDDATLQPIVSDDAMLQPIVSDDATLQPGKVELELAPVGGSGAEGRTEQP